MRIILLAMAVALWLVSPAVAMQTEVDPQEMHHKREAKIKWDRQQQRERRLAAIAAADAAEAAASASSSNTAPAPPAAPSGSIDWYAIAQCESGGNWYVNSTYDGGLQFHPDTWLAAGGGNYAPYAYLASPGQQIAVAENLVAMTGCVQCSSGWPRCGRYA